MADLSNILSFHHQRLGGGTYSYLPYLSEVIWIDIRMSLFGRKGPVRGYVLESTLKKTSSISMILVASGTLASGILTYYTSLVVTNDR